MKRIKQINEQLKQLEVEMRILQPMHDFLIKAKRKEELEKELQVLIKTNK